MISLILYDNDKNRREVYIKIVKKFLYKTLDYYKIYEFDRYSLKVEESFKHIGGTKIYIINIDGESPNSLNIARKIRDDGDFNSPIILTTKNAKEKVVDNLQNILFLDIISDDENMIAGIFKSLKDAYNIVKRNDVYTFSAFDEIYRIPYSDINFIMKNINDDSVTIYTKDDTYLDYITVKKLETLLRKDPRFFKSHRSCILNLNNVSSYDKKHNLVIFKDGMTTNLISRHNKMLLSERLTNEIDA